MSKDNDWQLDIDDDGHSIGVCPHCGAKAHIEYDIKTDRIRWECVLGHVSPWEKRP